MIARFIANFSIFVISGYRGGGNNYNRGGGRYDRGDRSDHPGSHANFSRRDRRDSDRRQPPSEDFREATAGKKFQRSY